MSPQGPAEVVFQLSSDRGPTSFHDEPLFFDYEAGPAKVPGPWKRGRPKGVKQQKKSLLKCESRQKRSRAVPQFQFVNLDSGSAKLDKAARDVVRKHARRGHTLLANHASDLSEEADDDVRKAEEFRRKTLLILSQMNLPQIAGVDPFNTALIKLEPYMHDLLICYSTTIWKHLYSLEKLANYNPFIEYWLPFAFEDPAVLHAFIGCADAYIDYFRQSQNPERGLWHLYEATSIVNRRLLQESGQVTPGTLVIVVGMALIERGADCHDNYRVHMRGLKHLVSMSGGLDSFSSNPMIMHKIHRADLYGALDDVRPPSFDGLLPKVMAFPSDEGSFDSSGFHELRETFAINELLCKCVRQFEEASHFWSQWKRYSLQSTNGHNRSALASFDHLQKPTGAEVNRVRLLFTKIQYTLVSEDMDQQILCSQHAALLNLCRISLILYSLTILNERPPNRPFGHRLGDRFRDALTEVAGTLKGTHKALQVDLLLWSLVMAGNVVQCPRPDFEEWLCTTFVSLALTRGGKRKRDLESLKRSLGRFLWIRDLHNSICRNMWMRCFPSTLLVDA